MNLKEVLLGIKSWSEDKFASKEDLENIVGPGVNYQVVGSLPSVEDGDPKVFYLVGPIGDGTDKYEEYIFTNLQYVKIGDTSVDLSGYVTSSSLGPTIQAYLQGYVNSADLAAELNGVLRASDIYEWAKAENKPSYDYSEISNTPTNVSEFTNDAGYLTSHQDISGKANVGDSYTKAEVDSLLDDIKNLKEESDSYDYIYDEASWNASFESGALKKYYTKYPDEDRYNTQEHRWAWAVDKVDGEWPEWCVQCWEGAVNANAAKFPWICPNFDEDVNSKIIFKYEGKSDVYPWGENVFGIGRKADGSDRLWGIASVAEEFGDKGFLIPENQNNGEESWSGEVGANNFDISKFTMILVKQSDDLKAYVDANFQPKGEYLTEHQDISGKANVSDLSEVATSGSYNDLSDKPTDVSDFTNDAGYLTSHQDISGKQDVIADLDDIRSGATLGASAYQKPVSGIPASDIEDGVIPDVSGFITESVNNLTNYYLKTETYTKAEVAEQIASAITGSFVYSPLIPPSASENNLGKIYLIPSDNPEEGNIMNEYIVVDNGREANPRYTWELIGNTSVDLSGYATTSALNSAVEAALDSIPFVEGSGTDSAEQWNCTAAGNYAFASGKDTLSSGSASHTEGNSTTAAADNAHAEGYRTTANGANAHIEGRSQNKPTDETIAKSDSELIADWETKRFSLAKGNAAHVEGYNNIALANYSHAEGAGTAALAAQAHSEGYFTKATNIAEHAEGKFNVSNTGTIHSIGIGAAEATRKNAFEVMDNGDVYLYGVGGYDGTSINNATTLQDSIYIKPASGIPASDLEDGVIPQIDLSDYVTTEALNSAVLLESGDGANSLIQKGNNNAVAFGANSTAFGTSSTNAKERGITSESTVETILSEWAGSNPEDDKFALTLGEASHIEGNNCLALGKNSHAEGNGTVASNNSSHAEGTGSKATGKYAHAEGLETQAQGNRSHTEGQRTIASGDASHAEGEVTIASGEDSHAEGFKTKAAVLASHAEGNRTVINEGGRSHTEGYGTYATGVGAHAEGINGYYIVLQRSGSSGNVYNIRQIEDMTPADALAAGKYPKVGDLDAEDGKTIKSVDTENHTITMSGNWGGNNKWSRRYFIINDIEDTSLRGNDGALKFATHSEGVHTKANGWGSHAEGEMTVANGATSHVEGWRTIAENQCEHAQGQYNVSHKASGSFGDAGNTIHSVGIGNRTDDYGNGDRKNAVEIMQNGDAYLYGIGGYDGVSLSGASTLKQVIDSKGTYSKPSAGIPASDLASGVIPDVSGLETRVGNIESQLEEIEALLASI